MNIRHIFFDLDHTLWDFDKNSGLTFQQIFNEQNIAIDFEDFIKVYYPINSKYWELYRHEKISKPALRYGRLKDTFDTLQYTISDDLIYKIANDYIDYLPNFNHLLPNAIEILDYLQSTYQLHIITNGFEKVQYLKLKKSGIKKYFDQIVTSESIGLKKPNPKVFEFALASANADPANSVMIGDSYEADILGALHVGMLAVYLSPLNEKQEKAIVSIRNLLELKDFL